MRIRNRQHNTDPCNIRSSPLLRPLSGVEQFCCLAYCTAVSPQSTYTVYKEYHSVCPLVGIGTPPTPLGGGGHSPAGEGLGESQFQRLEKKLSTLPTQWVPPFWGEFWGWADWIPSCRRWAGWSTASSEFAGSQRPIQEEKQLVT